MCYCGNLWGAIGRREVLHQPVVAIYCFRLGLEDAAKERKLRSIVGSPTKFKISAITPQRPFILTGAIVLTGHAAVTIFLEKIDPREWINLKMVFILKMERYYAACPNFCRRAMDLIPGWSSAKAPPVHFPRQPTPYRFDYRLTFPAADESWH